MIITVYCYIISRYNLAEFIIKSNIMKKTFIVTYSHNYGLGVAIINSSNIDLAKEIADKSNYIWKPYSIEELDETTELQILSE